MPVNFQPSTPIGQIIIPGVSPQYLQAQALAARQQEAERQRQFDAQQAEQDRIANAPIKALQQQQLQNQLALAPIVQAKEQADLDQLLGKLDAAKKLKESLPPDATPFDLVAVEQYVQQNNASPPMDPATGKVDLVKIRSINETLLKNKEEKERAGRLVRVEEDVKNPDGSIGKKVRLYDPVQKTFEDVSESYDASKTAYADKAAAEQREKDVAKEAKIRNVEESYRVVKSTADAARAAIKKAKDAGVSITGWGALKKFFPGESNEARRLDQLLATIRARVGFDELTKMRAASPTGGALGQVTERELGFLQAVLGALDQFGAEDFLLNNLDQIEKSFENLARVSRGELPKTYSDGTPVEGTAPSSEEPGDNDAPAQVSAPEGQLFDLADGGQARRAPDGRWIRVSKGKTAAPEPPVAPSPTVPTFQPGQPFSPTNLNIRALPQRPPIVISPRPQYVAP